MLNDTLPDILHQWTLKGVDEPMRAEAVQVGYWSICVKLHQGDWQCRLRQPAAHIADPLRIVEAAFDFQKHVTSSVLVYVTVNIIAYCDTHLHQAESANLSFITEYWV